MFGSAMSLGEEEEGLEGATALLSKGGDESLFWVSLTHILKSRKAC
jgi:hypothetical protein